MDIRVNAKRIMADPKKDRIIKRLSDHIGLTDKAVEVILERVIAGHIPEGSSYRFIRDCYTEKGDITIIV